MKKDNLRPGFGWRSRGYLPHFDDGVKSQFITIRLCDSLPSKILRQWRIELVAETIDDVEFRKRIDYFLDQGHGSCYLKDERVAEMVRENLLFHDGKKYDLHSWVIMPNHLHYLITPRPPFELAEITHSNKSYTAHKANEILKREGQFWFHESFDRFIRNDQHFRETVRYIENNPVKTGLCERPEEWRFSSAFGRE